MQFVTPVKAQWNKLITVAMTKLLAFLCRSLPLPLFFQLAAAPPGHDTSGFDCNNPSHPKTFFEKFPGAFLRFLPGLLT